MKNLTKEQAIEVVDAVNGAIRDGFNPHGRPSARQEAANRLGVSLSQVRDRLNRAREIYGLKPDPTLKAIHEVEGKQRTVEEVYREDKVLLQEENRHLKRELKNKIQELDEAEDAKSIVYELRDHDPKVPKWAVAAQSSGKKGKAMEMPVLFTSDFQWGETVFPEDIDNLNEFNVEIAKRRYRNLISKTIDICKNHHANPNYPGIVYLRGGDSISGGIHQELRETDALTPQASVKDLAEVECWGIEKLREAFGKVHVYSVPGNHGRTTEKPRAKKYSDLNYDDLLSWMIEKSFRDRKIKDVTFMTPPSGDCYFPIYNVNFLLTHGDRIGARGGQGFIGPAAVVLKGVYKTRQQYHQIGKHIDVVLMGHFHEPMWFAHGMVNGSLVGFNEYARGLRIEPHPACQWLFFVHPNHGIVEKRLIYLEE